MSTGERLYHLRLTLGKISFTPFPFIVRGLTRTLFSFVPCECRLPCWIDCICSAINCQAYHQFSLLIPIGNCFMYFYSFLDREPFLYSTGSQTQGGTNVWVEREQFSSNFSKVWKDFDKKAKSSVLGLSSITLSSFILLKNLHKYC